MNTSNRWMNSTWRIALLSACVGLVGCGGGVEQVVVDSSEAAKVRDAMESGAGEVKAAVVAQDPVGWATIRGVVRLDGAAPAAGALTLTGDDATACTANGTPMSEVLIAGSGGELKNVILQVSSEIPKDNAAWIHPDYAQFEPKLTGEAGFDQKGCVFLSHVYAFRAGQTIEIINSDSLGHNTNISGGEGKGGQAARAFNQLVAAGSRTEYDPGGACNLPMKVGCNIHPWMAAYILVCDHPYFMVTGDDGSFELKNVPAGVELELKAWTEAKANVADADGGWKRGRRTITLKDGEVRTLDLTVTLK